MHASAQRIVWRRPACPHFVSCKTCGTRQRLCSGHVRAKTLPGLWPLSLKSRNGRNTCHTSRRRGRNSQCLQAMKNLHSNPSKSQVHPGEVYKCLADGLEVPQPGPTPAAGKKTPTFQKGFADSKSISYASSIGWKQNLKNNLMPATHQRVLQFLLEFLLLGWWSLFEMASALHHSFPYLHGKSLTMQATRLRNEVAGGSKIWLSRWLMLFGWYHGIFQVLYYIISKTIKNIGHAVMRIKKNDIFCIHSTNAFSFSNKHLLSWRISPEIRTCPKEQIAGICVEDMCMVCVCVLTCMRPLCLFELWKQASCKFKCKLPKSETIKMNPSPNLRVLSVWTGVGSSSRNFRRLACHNSEVMTKSIGISGIESGWGFLVLRLMGYSTRPYCANIINM